MVDKSVKEEGGSEVDLESGLTVVKTTEEEDSKNVSTTQGKTLFAKISCGLVGDSLKGEDPRHNNSVFYLNDSNLSGVSIIDMVDVKNKLLVGQDLVTSVEKNTLVKEKRKKSSSHNKKASAKPPRPPRAPSLDAADHKLIREISELAMLKRARMERMKALKRMKATKSSSSSSSSMFALVFTVVFCIVIFLQGMSPGKSSVASFQGSPVSAGGAEDDLITVQHHLNPWSSGHQHAPSSLSHKILQQVTGSDLPIN